MGTHTNDILDRLPHRPPFRFVTDGFTRCGDAARATWRVSGKESIFKGHFPGAPIVPGVLIGEALAQLSGLIVAAKLKEGRGAGAVVPGKLAHLDMRFTSTVTPPAAIELSSTLERVFQSLWQFEAAASWNDTVVARGTLALAMTEEKT